MKNMNILVTGAAGGIGLACTRMLLEDGANLTAFDIQGDLMAKELPTGHERLLLVQGDQARTENCQEVVASAIDRYGHLDALIHWGAAHSSARWDELGADEVNHVLAVNVTGSLLLAQAAAHHMTERGEGNIVLCTSTSVLYGVTGGNGQGGPAYVASKGAVIALMRSLARALGPKGIRVNAVSPGLTETPMIESYTDEQRAAMTQRFPLGRFALPEEVANAAIYLISDKASFMTGEIMYVNGGSNFG